MNIVLNNNKKRIVNKLVELGTIHNLLQRFQRYNLLTPVKTNFDDRLIRFSTKM